MERWGEGGGTLRFGDGETHSVFTSEDGREKFAFLGWGAVVYYGWTAYCVSAGESPVYS